MSSGIHFAQWFNVRLLLPSHLVYYPGSQTTQILAQDHLVLPDWQGKQVFKTLSTKISFSSLLNQPFKISSVMVSHGGEHEGTEGRQTEWARASTWGVLSGCDAATLWDSQGHCMTTLNQVSSKPWFYREILARKIALLPMIIPLTWEKKMASGTNHLGKLAAVTISSCCHKDFHGALGVGGQGIELHFISTWGIWEATGKQMSTVLFWTFYSSQEKHSGPFCQIYFTILQ